jgi:hypothetical protein
MPPESDYIAVSLRNVVRDRAPDSFTIDHTQTPSIRWPLNRSNVMNLRRLLANAQLHPPRW